MAYDVPLRTTLEQAGYKVRWQGAGKPIKIEKGGKTYDIDPSAYKIRNGTAFLDSSALPGIMEKAGYEWVRKTFPTSSGYEPKYDPKTNTLSISHVLGGTYEYKSPVVAGGRAYVPPSVIQEAKSVTQPPYAAAVSDIAKMWADYAAKSQESTARHYAQQDAMLKDYLNQLNNFTKQYGDAAVAMLNVYQQHYKQALDQLQQLTEPDTRVPETVKVAISILRRNLDENLKELAEEMNRRGMYQSDVALDLERKMREGTLTEEQKLLAQWMDEAHQRAYDASLRYADYLAQYASGLSNLYGTAYMKPIELARQAAEQAYSLQSALAQSRYSDERSLQEKAFDILSKLRQASGEYEQSLAETLLRRRWQLEDEKRERQQKLEDWERQAALERELANIRAQSSSSGSGGFTLDELLLLALSKTDPKAIDKVLEAFGNAFGNTQGVSGE